jgi:hypothetical protein
MLKVSSLSSSKTNHQPHHQQIPRQRQPQEKIHPRQLRLTLNQHDLAHNPIHNPTHSREHQQPMAVQLKARQILNPPQLPSPLTPSIHQEESVC